MKTKIILSFLIILNSWLAFSQDKTQNIILITLDGARWQDVFTGADSLLIMDKTQTRDSATVCSNYWNQNPLKRREMLMPFFWNTVAQHGQIYGNRLYGNNVNVSNTMWFSYPGYSELLCGFADDKRINSNDLKPNPNKNVLEFINGQDKFRGKVAVYSSWDALPYIVNEQRSGISVNGAFEKVQGEKLTQNEILLNNIMQKLPEFIGGIRNDAVTFYLGMEYLKRKSPRALFIAMDETDDLAHNGRYDLYLNALRYEDQMIRELWDWVQSSPRYKNKTTLIITVDHGRGIGLKDWRSHGSKIQYSDQTWFAIMGPDVKALGEIKSPGQIYTNQVASTIANLLGLKYTNDREVGKAIPY